MILYPPVAFDANEWFTLGTMVLLTGLFLLCPRQFSPLIILGIWLLNFYLGQTADFIIGKPPYEFYVTNDQTKYEYFDLLAYLFIYPPAAYFVLAGYARWRPGGWRLAAYLLLCALMTMGIEGLAVIFHVFTYKGWQLAYSFPVYLFVYTVNILFLGFVQQYLPSRRGA